MPSITNPAGRIMQLLAPDRKDITAVYFYAILHSLIQLSLPVGVQAIIGFVAGASMRASLTVLIVLVVLGVFLTGIMQVNQMKIIEKIQQQLFARYSFAFAGHIPRFDLKKSDNIYLPEMVNRFFDIQNLQKSLAKILLEIPSATIQILFGLILLSLYHPAFILFGLILITLLWLIMRYTGRRGLETSIEESTYKYKVAGWLEEAARVARSAKFARTNDLHLRKTDEQVSNYLQARTGHFRILLFQYNTLIIFKTAITAAMLITGTLLLVHQQLNIGQFIAAEIVILVVINSVEKLIISLGSVYDALTAVAKLDAVTTIPAEKDGTLAVEKNGKGMKVEMKNVSFGYNEEADALQQISLQVNPGEKVCITGNSGSGKSTLLKLLTGSYSDFKGAILLNDIPIGNYDLSSLRSQTGVVLSQQEIFHGTLWENISLGNKAVSMDKVADLANKTGLSDFISSLKEGYNTELDPSGQRMPRSVVKKILLVRALATEPSLLLMEDPFEGLDEDRRRKLQQLLGGLSNTTLIMISHDAATQINFDKVLLLGSSGNGITSVL